MAHDVFISYAEEDRQVADAVCRTVEEAGVRCWYAPRDVPYAVDYEDAIVDAISESKLLVLILSEHSNNSAHVKREMQNACREKPQIPVLPFQIENTTLNKALRYYIGSVQWLSALTPPLETHLQKLVTYVQSRLPKQEEEKDATQQNGQSAKLKVAAEAKDAEQRQRQARGPLLEAADLFSERVKERPHQNMVRQPEVKRPSRIISVGLLVLAVPILMLLFKGAGLTTATQTAIPRLDPTVRPAEYIARGDDLFSQGKYVEAETYYRVGVDLDPYNSTYPYKLGNALVAQLKTNEAKIYYLKALRIEPDNPTYLEALKRVE